MLVYLRELALGKDKGYEVLQLYQKYPKVQGNYLKELIKLAWNIKELLDHPPTKEEEIEKKRKNLCLLEKGFTDQIRKEEAEQNKNKTKMLEPIVDKEVDKETNPIFYKKPQTQAEEPRHVEKAQSTKAEEVAKPLAMSVETPAVKEKPSPKPATVSPVVATVPKPAVVPTQSEPKKA